MIRLSVTFLLLALATDLLAVDLEALERLSIRATGTSSESIQVKSLCDPELQAELGHDLLENFDPCLGKKQLALMSQSLYRTQSGEVLPLPIAVKSSSTVSTVSIPMPDHEPVSEKRLSPIVLDIGSIARSNLTAQNMIYPHTSDRQSGAPNPPAARTSESLAKNPNQVRLGCPRFATFSHRGSATQPENSLEAVVAALRQGHSGVEVDVQQLRDGSWVIHHDFTVGRTTYGQKGLVSGMSAYQWRQVRLKNRQGQETRIPAPFLTNVLDAFNVNSHLSQVLNIEIKSGLKSYSCGDLTLLDQKVRKSLASSQFLYSSRSLETLACLRSLDPNGYLGLVVDPHPDSVRETTREQPKSRISKLLNRVSEEVDIADEYQHQSNRALLDKTSFTDVADLIGPNYGVHIDFRDYLLLSSKKPSELGRVVLYQLDDDEGLQALLSSLLSRDEVLPDGVLVDASRSDYCSGQNLVSQ
ncbi:glycerophosphodiester phosphodiesterase family protein [Halomonas sp. TRM85114]|uniref:glycerophosphodiester phosphodiesterase n=1 Tax=Halomonas jincaotanensis TaxID=2810616 RepID=UPI001BD4C4ED|nr:glycerophosphodiester phosphodiesterase family protein [Halomonas jincaotanensis]MBS9405451.1 glycerophosphodiester phosphodiesterase family protein [Halomonas jincaotanensis]